MISLALCWACSRPVPDFCDENTLCEDPAKPFCDFNGQHEESEFIGNTCIPYPWDASVDPGADLDAAVVDAPPTACTPATTTCDSSMVIVCDEEGNVASTEACELGCHPSSSRCNHLAPSNGLAAQLDAAATGPDVVLSSGATIDTSAGTITGTNIAVPTEYVTVSPGAGGGAMQIVSRTKITLGAGGAIAANGGSAKGDTSFDQIICIPGDPCGPGAGAGSGGGILLEAPVVEVAGTAALVANGGAGHCGLRGAGAVPGVAAAPAPGTSCNGFSGGDGATGSTAARDGTGETDGGGTGAGGGGGVGRIRVNLRPGESFSPAPGAVVSPAVTVGGLSVR